MKRLIEFQAIAFAIGLTIGLLFDFWTVVSDEAQTVVGQTIYVEDLK